jgi:transcriptional regulator with XRE-family HTH domain
MTTSRGIGDRVRELRLERDMSMRELAEKAELTSTAISYIERGLRAPGSETVEKLARGLDVDPGALFPKAEAPLV